MQEGYPPFLPLSVLAAAPHKNEVGEEIYLRYVAACLLKGGVALPRAEFDLNYSLESIRAHTNDEQPAKTVYLEILMQYASNNQDRLSDYKNFFEDARVSNPNSSVHFSNLVRLLEHSLQSGRNTDHEVVRYLLEKLKQHNRFIDILDLAETSIVMAGSEKLNDFKQAITKFLLLCNTHNLNDEYKVVIQNCVAHYKAPVDIKGEFDLLDLLFFLVSKSADLFSWIQWKRIYGPEFSAVLQKAEAKGILNAAQCAQFNALRPAFHVPQKGMHNIRECFNQPNHKETEEFFTQLNFQTSDALYETLSEQNKKPSVAFPDLRLDMIFSPAHQNSAQLPVKVFLGRSPQEINQFLSQDKGVFFSFLTGQPYDVVELKNILNQVTPDELPGIVGLMLAVPRTVSDVTELKPAAVFPDMSRIPLALYANFINYNGVIPQSFYDFVQLFDKANAHVKEQENAEEEAESGEEHLVNYDAFMVKNIFKLTGLHELLGSDLLFKLMMSKMGASNLVLDRFFESLGTVPERYASVIKTLAPMIKKNEYEIFGNILLLISQIEFFADELEQKGKKPAVVPWENLTRPPVNLSKIMEVLSDVLLTLYKDLLDVPKDVELDLSKLLSSPQLIRRLITGRGQLESNDYRAVFDRLVIQDLSNNKVEDELMQRLAAHNKAIVDELNSKGINAKLALDYPKQVAFSFDRNPGATDMTQLCDAVWKSLLELEKNIRAEENKEFAELSAVLALLTPLAKIRHEIEKGGIKSIKFLNDSLNTPLEKLLKLLTALLEKVKKGGIAEHGQHLKDHISALKAAKEKMSTSEKSTLAKTIPKKYSFHAKQWNKNDIHTFELGDFLGCCLATNRSQFQAMVQRRMDAGMLTDVVVDDELNEPISGNWLFFARDKDHPEDVYVVANFYEIRAGYGDKPALRDCIVQELTEFTAQYAKDIGAKGYLIRPLTYGLILDEHFSAQLGTKNIQLEKIGGFFDPLNRESVGEKDKQKLYYLLALELKQFHNATAPAKQEEKKYKSGFFSPASGPVPTAPGPAEHKRPKRHSK